MTLAVTEIGRITHHNDTPLSQPNGAALYPDGRFAIADGGNDRICLFASDGTSLSAFGTHGYNQFSFKEPVAVKVSATGQLFVCDWHNHRLVVYDDQLTYVTEFGRYAPPPGANRFYQLATFVQNLAFQGSYVQRFHDNSIAQERGQYNLRQAVSGWHYWQQRFGGRKHGWQAIFDANERLLKPNGVALAGDRIAVTDKDARAVRWLSWHDSALTQVDVWRGPSPIDRFGRLGNITRHPDKSLLICDEYAHTIWRMGLDGNTVSTISGENSGTGAFLPFSCTVINDNLIAVCGGLNFQLIDLHSNDVIFFSEQIGELHGIEWDAQQQRLLVCNRSENRIDLYRITQD